MPIVIAVSYGLVLGRVTAGTPTFFLLAAILLPITVCFARLFAAVFESPPSGTAGGSRCGGRRRPDCGSCRG